MEWTEARPDVMLCCNDGRKLLAHRRILSEAFAFHLENSFREVNYFESLFEGNFAERGSDLLTVEEAFRRQFFPIFGGSGDILRGASLDILPKCHQRQGGL